MTPEDFQLFKKHMPLYESYKKHAFIRNYDKEVYTEMIHLYTTYVSPKHNFSHWCSSCRMELVNYLYGWFTNEQQTTWYREQEEMLAILNAEAEVSFTLETLEAFSNIDKMMGEMELTRAKRGRKPKNT
jgi:elongation factor P hydroxylase